MSVSTNAMLVYGYVWEDEADLLNREEEDETEWTEVVARQRGIVNPWDAYPPEIEALPYDQRREASDQWCDEHRGALNIWNDAKQAIAEEYGVEISSHGSGEWSCPVVKILDAGWIARRGYPQNLSGEELNRNPEWDKKLADFCRDLEIDLTEAKGPGWFLASWWC